MSGTKVDTSRRSALTKLGLLGFAAAGAYVAPALLGISKARAGSAADGGSDHKGSKRDMAPPPPPPPASDDGSEW